MPRDVGTEAASGGTFLDPGDPVRRVAADDPMAFVRDLPEPVVIDEFHRVPDVLAAIKAELNRDRRPGHFVLAGFARHHVVPEFETQRRPPLIPVTYRVIRYPTSSSSSARALAAAASNTGTRHQSLITTWMLVAVAEASGTATSIHVAERGGAAGSQA